MNQAKQHNSDSHQVQAIAVLGIPDIQPGDNLSALIAKALAAQNEQLQDGDILVVAHKVVSKAEGKVIDLTQVEASAQAHELAAQLNKDPAKIEVILQESSRVVRTRKRPDQDEGLIITQHKQGFICANAAVDESNIDQPNHVITLPDDPDASARALCSNLESCANEGADEQSKIGLGVVITDTFGRPWRMGLVNVAIGLANVPSKVDLAGETDAYGRELRVTVPALADELAAASGLLMSKEGKKPVILFRGVTWQATDSTAADLLRPASEDLFRQ